MLDTSNYFHMFRTRDEQKYFGVIHPGTGLMYVYDCLPMGICNSTGALVRFDAAFIHHALDSSSVVNGHYVDNSAQAYLFKHTHHPHFGEDRVLIGSDSLLVTLICMHVGDILVHAPTRGKLVVSLKYILNTMVKLGIIYQPCKTISST